MSQPPLGKTSHKKQPTMSTLILNMCRLRMLCTIQCKSLPLPHPRNYAGFSLASNLNRIYYLQKRAVRVVTNSEYRAHTAPLFSKLKILDIFQINTFDIAKFMFRYHNNLLPPLFLNLFTTNSQVHNYDTRTAGNYRVHSCRTNIKKFTILYQGPRIWNCLPASITNLSSFPTFKKKVLEFLLK